MSDVIGRGVIEVSADATKLKAGIEEAKRTIKGLGVSQAEVSKAGAASIDRYIQRLQVQAVTTGKSAREAELLKLGLRGASDAQILAADTALRLKEQQEGLIATQKRLAAESAARVKQQQDASKQLDESLTKLDSNLRRIGVAAAVGFIAASVAFDQLIKKSGDFQDLSEIMGDTASNVASLAVAASVGGRSMEEISSFSVKLTKNLTGVDDESEKAGAAIKALGLDIAKFKALAPAEQLEALAKQLEGFADDKGKTAVLEALAKGGANLLPVLKELSGESGRQNILTAEQIKLSDEYVDTQKRVAAQLSLQAQSIAADLLPSMAAFQTQLIDIAKDQETAATATDILRESFAAAVVIFQTIAVLASDVGFVFLGVGREIAAIAAQLEALSRLDFAGFTAISDAVKEDGVRARAELDKFQARVMELGKTPPSGAGVRTVADSDDAGSGLGKSRPRINFNGDNKGAREAAKSQLALDLAQIKQANDVLVNGYANAEKILEARRSANLIQEKDYYAAKLGFIELNSRAQEDALQQEIARLGKEKFSGKEKIDNDRKIAETQAKLVKVRADAAAATSVNSIQEEAANRKIAQSYVDAREAADAYIDSIKRRNALELEGIGRGEKFRQIQSGRFQIEDKFLTERRRLERDQRNGNITGQQFEIYLETARKTYEEEVRLYEERTRIMLEKEKDWSNGAKEALQNYYDESQNIAKQTEEVFTRAFKGMEDALVEFVKTGKLDFKSLADSIISDIIRITIQQQVTGPLAKWLGEGIGAAFGGGGGGWVGSGDMDIPSFAVGTDFVPRDMLAFIHKGEKITPAAENRGGMDGSTVVHQTIQFSANTPAAVRDAVLSMMPQIRRETVAAVQDQRNRNGDSR